VGGQSYRNVTAHIQGINNPSATVKSFHYVRRLFQQPPSYLWGRFHLVRALYSRWQRLRDRLGGRTLPPLEGLPASPFMNMDARTAVADLRKTALARCIVLPPDMVDEIVRLAREEELESSGVTRPFRYADVKYGHLPDGTFVAMAYCRKLGVCPAVRRILDDAALKSIVANYLRYIPRSEDVVLYWSFAGAATDDDRRKRNQTIDYHFDVHDYNFCYIHIYLTNTDAKTGAHVMVLGSHRSKPVRWLFGSARQTDEAIERRYGKDRLVCLEGPAGLGFVEDTSCYHKALAPVNGDRLLLQIRYH
jgi:hypothetical protein